MFSWLIDFERSKEKCFHLQKNNCSFYCKLEAGRGWGVGRVVGEALALSQSGNFSLCLGLTPGLLNSRKPHLN